MVMDARFRSAADFGDAIRSIRTGLAFLALTIGVAGTLATVPLAVWGLAARGFH